MELLESIGPRPRQARYQAALRPDMKYPKIIKYFPTELLLDLTNFTFNGAKTVPIGVWVHVLCSHADSAGGR
jgi:hypothetical protein